jgi:hypothetical protein
LTVFVSDTFTDTDGTLLEDHTPEVGSAWIKRAGTGTSGIQSNVLQPVLWTSHTNGAVPGSNEYDINCDFTPDTSTNNVNFWVYGYYQDESNMYFARYAHSAGGGFLDIWKRVLGAYTKLDTLEEALIDDTAVDFKFELRNDPVQKLYIDDVEKLSTTDSDLTDAGVVGVRLFANYTVDNFIANDTATAESTNASMQPIHHWWPR